MTLDLRPLSLGELFDRAFMLYRRHFWLFIGITAIPGIFALVLTLTQAGLQALVPQGGEDAVNAEPSVEQVLLIIPLFAGMVLAMLVYWVAYMIALGATTLVVSDIYVGRGTTIASAYGRVRSRIVALFILFLQVGVRIFGLGFLGVLIFAGIGGGLSAVFGPLGAAAAFSVGGLVLVVGCGFLALRYSLSIPALMLEGLTAGDAIRRSIELTRGRLLQVLLLGICSTLVTYAALVIFQGPFYGAALMSGLETRTGFWLNVVGAVFGTIGATLTTPFLIIGLALMYYDARVREEGLDLELSLAALDRV